MASHAPARPVTLVLPVDAIVRHGLWIAVAAAVVVRLAALVVLEQPLASDGLAYFTLAKSLAETGVPVDQFGHHTFYSPGYPLLLAPFFAVFGAGSPVAHFVNLGLAGVTAALVWQLVRTLGGGRGAAAVGALGYAAWLPAIWQATDLAKENLSTPLMVGFAILISRIAQGDGGWRGAALAGVVFGAGLLTGTSIALTAGAFVLALWFAFRRTPRAALRPLGIFAAATLAVLTPWLIASDAMVGRPVITTNGPFNLYIGNNPAANGHFVSIRETPLGSIWHERIEMLGETGTADWLAQETRDWIAANPAAAAGLAVRKLGLFWAPNLPDSADFATTPLVAGLRIVDVIQWALIVGLAGLAFWRRELDPRVRWVLMTLVAGFWVIHGATYIIPRYRDPIMPVLIALAAIEAARLGRGWTRA